MNNILSLAYLGDSVYELIIRSYLIDNGVVKPDKLQKEAIKHVSAKAQARYMDKLLNKNILKEIPKKSMGLVRCYGNVLFGRV